MHMSPKERIGYACLGGIILFAFGYIGAQRLRQPAPIVFENRSPAVGRSAMVDRSSAAPSAESSVTTAASGPVVVDVAGAVKNPGVVHLPADSRVVDALHAVGGPQDDADLSQVNLAAKLVDGTQLKIPEKEPAGSSVSNKPARASTRHTVPPLQIDKNGYFAPVTVAPEYQPRSATASLSSPVDEGNAHRSAKKTPAVVDINTAGLEELQALPDVGPATAQKILDYRQQNGAFKTVDELTAVKGIGEKKLEKMRPYVRL